MKVNFKLALEIKTLESGGRVERKRIQSVGKFSQSVVIWGAVLDGPLCGALHASIC